MLLKIAEPSVSPSTDSITDVAFDIHMNVVWICCQMPPDLHGTTCPLLKPFAEIDPCDASVADRHGPSV